MQPFKTDYWGYFKYSVKLLNISPSEAWNLDMVEIDCLSENKDTSLDLTIMLNYEREKNGASKEWLTQKA